MIPGRNPRLAAYAPSHLPDPTAHTPAREPTKASRHHSRLARCGGICLPPPRVLRSVEFQVRVEKVQDSLDVVRRIKPRVGMAGSL